MKEYMYNLYDEEAIITESGNGTVLVEVEDIERTFQDYEKAIRFLERNGYRF